MNSVLVFNRKISYLSFICLVLFCWIIYPYKWIKKAVFYHRKGKAINKAKDLSYNKGHKFFVVQNGMKFIVGDRNYFRGMNTKYKKKIKGSQLSFDYRDAIIFTANERVANS